MCMLTSNFSIHALYLEDMHGVLVDWVWGDFGLRSVVVWCEWINVKPVLMAEVGWVLRDYFFWLANFSNDMKDVIST